MNKQLTQDDVLVAVNKALTLFFEESLQQAKQIDSSYHYLWQVMYQLIQSGGKRLRPRMTLMAYAAFGGNDPAKMIPVAVAQELLHFSLLIHDDIIDRDYTRYGARNVAGTYKETYAQYAIDSEDRIHFAHGAAILGGDLMLSSAHKLIALSSLNDEEKMAAQSLLAQGVFEVAAGELLDTESSFVPSADGHAHKIARYKTAGYSFVTPLLTGATIAGATSEQLQTLRAFAVELGVAFQLADDLLGVFGDELVTGKSTTSDITEGKQTFMIEQATRRMSTEQSSRFSALFGKQSAMPDEIAEVRQILVDCGAKAATEQQIQEHADKAADLLTALKLDHAHHGEFMQLVARVTKRAY